MKAVVLAGGQGSRLRPYTFSVPKPLLPLGDRPLLDYLIAQLVRCGVTEIILSLGYHAELIRAYAGDGSQFGVRLSYVEEPRPLGTAGPLALCRPALGSEPFLVVNGDIVTRLDFAALAKFHRDRGAQMTFGYVHHTYQSPFGVLHLEDDVLTGVEEKPQYVHPVAAGIYCISPSAVDLIPPDTPMPMPELALRVREAGGLVAAYEIKAFWRALETKGHFEELADDVDDLQDLLKR